MPLGPLNPKRLTRTERAFFEEITPYLDRAEHLPVQSIAHAMGYAGGGAVSSYLTRFRKAGVIARIDKGVYVRAGDPRIPKPGDLRHRGAHLPPQGVRIVPRPHMVPGLTLGRLMAGR